MELLEGISMKRPVLSLFVLLTVWFALALPATFSQSQSPTAASQTAPEQTPPAAGRNPAKVWTNDDVDNLRKNQSVSVVGNDAGKNKTDAPSRPTSYQRDPTWYRQQLAPLEADVEKLDTQIAKLKAFISGENVGELQPYRHSLPVSPQDQLNQLEKKRQADAAKIDDLLDRARHNGVEPGALR
jgi:hypothetical protein